METTSLFGGSPQCLKAASPLPENNCGCCDRQPWSGLQLDRVGESRRCSGRPIASSAVCEGVDLLPVLSCLQRPDRLATLWRTFTGMHARLCASTERHVSSHACFVRQPAEPRRGRCRHRDERQAPGRDHDHSLTAPRYRDCPQHRCCGQRLRVTHHSNSGNSLRGRAATSASSVRGSARGICGREGVGRQHQATAPVGPNDGWCPPNARRGTKTRARRWG